jgi:hypothetical protein
MVKPESLLALSVIIILSVSSPAIAQESVTNFGYGSPKPGWSDQGVATRGVQDQKREEGSFLSDVLLWLPNRVLDLSDMVRADVGIGIAGGAVVRVTRPLQVGARFMAPGSARVGLFGRRTPAMFERSNEFGIGPAFVGSKDRNVCLTEVGVGVDFIVGGYLGICADELPDFLGGFVFLDPRDDDL